MSFIYGFIVRFISKLSPELYFTIAYFHHRKKLPNFKVPKDLSELWIKRIINKTNNRYYKLADKYSVREYVSNKGYSNILPRLIKYYIKGEQFSLSELPNRFALKAVWGAGMNIICTDKSKLDEKVVQDTINKWLNSPTCSYSESHYNLIDRKVICEEFIDDGTGGFPIDYKFICIKGEVLSILVCNGRESGKTDYIPYDVNWNPQFDYCISSHVESELFPAPNNLKSMIKIAKKLAEDVDLVRVDLYSNGNKIWFGEMTLSPDGGIFRRWTQKAIDEMGLYYRTH